MKSREFWLRQNHRGTFFVYDKPYENPVANLIHVIEYSAYEALEKKNAKQMEWIERKREHLTNHDAITLTIHKKTLEENKIMREALANIQNVSKVPDDKCEHQRLAYEALEKCGSTEPTTGHVKSNECYRKECDGNHVEAEDEKATLPIDVMSTANLTGSSGNGTDK